MCRCCALCVVCCLKWLIGCSVLFLRCWHYGCVVVVCSRRYCLMLLVVDCCVFCMVAYRVLFVVVRWCSLVVGLCVVCRCRCCCCVVVVVCWLFVVMRCQLFVFLWVVVLVCWCCVCCGVLLLLGVVSCWLSLLLGVVCFCVFCWLCIVSVLFGSCSVLVFFCCCCVLLLLDWCGWCPRVLCVGVVVVCCCSIVVGCSCLLRLLDAVVRF